MNVKANKIISEIPGVEELFVFPVVVMSHCPLEQYGQNMHVMLMKRLRFRVPLNDLYLGREFDDSTIKSVIEDRLRDTNCEYRSYINDQIVAKVLAANNVVARFSGRMEWGARALGNRSIC